MLFDDFVFQDEDVIALHFAGRDTDFSNCSCAPKTK